MRVGGCGDNVCDVEVVVVECCGVNDCVMTGGSDDCDEVTMVSDMVGVWVAEVGGIGRCASVVCSDG